MREATPLLVTFSLINGDCRVAKALREEGLRDFRVLGIRPEDGKFAHLVEVREKKGCALKMMRSEGCELCRVISSSGAFLLSARAKGELMKLEVVIPSKQSLRRLVSKLKTFPRFRLISMRDGVSDLTERQEEVLLSALRMGYFDLPRRVRTKELAQMLGVSAPTLAELLRRAVRKLVMNYFSYSMKHDATA